ncbi:similar to Saccharomyces cerevisiae YIL001W Putative protein of unknown function [Maudiozyma barnettii]|uniref:BTB domain-containing protein n=1 Tax=Maudiozyma barnettii TaxID=61262 RepID=A0A8H2ZIY9_9SACH|nr:hypothetical protein [Kazachstania barnettii]CAB4256388.1 similar to Saccharomyces cerevisiae YIL001W Putative protein of unknown function [Kazachstania barnettii]CAD1784997.1 similar to Saccharomyces cerevisiae YIL001W Putative protein of unknown function [Kazachstania barnettii]
MDQDNERDSFLKGDFDDLCYFCRTGDVENADRLISTGININQVDKFDNSPLYLASLCGHIEVVKLLLGRGAICDRDRHEGARCIYGALTDAIRDMLYRYDNSKKFDTNQPFAAHITSLLKDEESRYEMGDVTIKCKDPEIMFIAHKFMIFARSSALHNSTLSELNETFSGLSNDVVNILINFIYLVPILHAIPSVVFPDLIKLANYLQLDLLSEFLDKARHMADPVEKSNLMIGYQYKFTELARSQLKKFVQDDIIDKHIDIGKEPWDSGSIPDPHIWAPFPDIYLIVENYSGLRRIYPCHIAMLSRAEFFKDIINKKFRENNTYMTAKQAVRCGVADSHMLFAELPVCDFGVAEAVINYLYYDSSEFDPKHAFDVIKLADYIMADRLKNIAAAVITQSSEDALSRSVFDILHLGWETGVERLEQFSAKYIAQHLEELTSSKELRKVILESSQRISNREETDTIELVADVRFYLLSKYDLEADDLSLLESDADDLEFLQSLGLLDYQKDINTLNTILNNLNLSV